MSALFRLVLGVAVSAASMPASSPRPTYPISPRPLRMLVEEAEVIVTAEVKPPNADTPPAKGSFPATKEKVASTTIPNGPRPDVVLLEVDRVLKGDPGARVIAQTNYQMICPAPARYVVGTRVLAFLDRMGDGSFTTHALSYGAKTLGDAESEKAYVDRVIAQLAILALPKDEKRSALQVEWLVRCAEAAPTRWEGAYDLCPGGDFMSDYEQRVDSRADFAKALTPAQLDRLRDALLAAKSFDSGEQCLEELFRKDRDPRLLAWLVAQLRATAEQVEKESYCTASMVIERIARRDPRAEVRRLVEAFKAKQTFGFKNEIDDGAGRLRIVRELLALY